MPSRERSAGWAGRRPRKKRASSVMGYRLGGMAGPVSGGLIGAVSVGRELGTDLRDVFSPGQLVEVPRLYKIASLGRGPMEAPL